MGFGQVFAKSLISNVHICSRFRCMHDIPKDKSKTGTKEALLRDIQPKNIGKDKVTIIGVGSLGVACAYTFISQSITNYLCLIDSDEKRLAGEALDLMHGACLFENLYIDASTDYAASANSKVCIVTAGLRQKEGESRLNLAQRNTDIIKPIIPELARHSPNAVILIATNPVDILTYVAWKLSGFPSGRVIGTGTHLDSSRFRCLLAKRLGIAPASCHGWIIGEHGDSSVAVWSGINVAGVRFAELKPLIGTPEDPENWDVIHQKVIASAYDIIKMKGYTTWGAAMSIASLTRAILGDFGTVGAVSFLVKGYYGIKDDVCLSLPAVLGKNGVTDVIMQPLTDMEITNLHRSAECVAKVQNETNFLDV